MASNIRAMSHSLERGSFVRIYILPMSSSLSKKSNAWSRRTNWSDHDESRLQTAFFVPLVVSLSRQPLPPTMWEGLFDQQKEMRCTVHQMPVPVSRTERAQIHTRTACYKKLKHRTLSHLRWWPSIGPTTSSPTETWQLCLKAGTVGTNQSQSNEIDWELMLFEALIGIN